MEPLVSVIIPVYQVEKYISAAIKSICAQTYENYEVILVNDGTKDRSLEIAETIFQKCGFRNYKIINQENQGVSVARNIGMASARGEWLICVDSDDYFLENFIYNLVEAAEKYKEKHPDIIIGNYLFKREGKVKRNLKSIKGDSEYIEQEALIKGFLNRSLKVISPGMLIRRAFLEKEQLQYSQSIRFSEDTLFIWNCIFCANGAVYSHQKNYIYVIRDNSTMTSSDKDKVLNGFYGYKAFVEKLKTQNKNLAEMIMARWVLGVLHSSAKMLEFYDYKDLAHQMNYKFYLKQIKEFPDIKTRILGRIAGWNLWIMYYLCTIR